MRILVSNPNFKEKPQGFSYIELILVVALIFILAGISTTFYSRFLSQNAVSNTVDQLAGTLRKAQIYAVSGKQNGGDWGVHFASQTITLYQGTSFAARNQALDENISVNSAITLSGFSDIKFSHATGLPIPSTPATITVQDNNATSKTITVNSMGIVSKL